jgi:diphthine-ammonia ligase
MKAFVSWSGGKDSALAHYRAHGNPRMEIVYAVTMLAEDGLLSRSHHIHRDLIAFQAEQVGLQVIQTATTWTDYEARFKQVLTDLKVRGVEVGVFGDIDVEEHKEWVERVCRDIGMTAVLPLWHCNREGLLKEFITAGFKATVVATDRNHLGHEWLGRETDSSFMVDLKGLPAVDLCGEKGEYHTFVYDGPLFRKQVEFLAEEPTLSDDHWFLPLRGLQT